MILNGVYDINFGAYFGMKNILANKKIEQFYLKHYQVLRINEPKLSVFVSKMIEWYDLTKNKKKVKRWQW